jgi:AcrR family transcriptional regulator
MPVGTAAKESRTLTRDDWINAAIDVMVRDSVEQLVMENLASSLGASRGSFYWHFKSRDALLEAILDRWTQTATIAVGEHLDQQEHDAAKRLLLYLRLPLKSARSLRAADFELAILGWARRSDMARKAVARVDGIRTEMHTKLFLELGFPPAEARTRAHMTYALMRYIAWRRDIDVDKRLDLINSMHAKLVEGASNS